LLIYVNFLLKLLNLIGFTSFSLSKYLIYILPRWILRYIPIYTLLMSVLLYYGYHRKYNELSLNEDSKIFTGDDVLKPRTFLFDELQIMHIKETYVNELTSK